MVLFLHNGKSVTLYGNVFIVQKYYTTEKENGNNPENAQYDDGTEENNLQLREENKEQG
jgi:hypothetical protein